MSPRRLERLRYSPSCYLLLAGSSAQFPQAAHHNLHFGAAWREVFEDLDSGRLMRDPSLLVSNPTRSDPGLAPPGRHIYYVLFPTPNLDAGIDWERTAPRYREHVLRTLQARGYPDFAAGIEVEHVFTPLDWADLGMERGTPFAAAHTFAQTGPFRPGNLLGRERRAGRVRAPAGRGGADGAAVRAAGRRAHRRAFAGLPLPRLALSRRPPPAAPRRPVTPRRADRAGCTGVSARALDAAGIDDPQLRSAFETCRRLHAQHGRTFYLATALLPAAKRPYVWALYGFARYADEFVDSLAHPDPHALLEWGSTFLDALGHGTGEDPVGLAMMHTMRRWGIPRAHVEAFLDSMRMDIGVTRYQTYADLEQYMYGSAAVIGLQMLPILEPLAPEAGALARALGEAFQMSNFVRDVGEDLARGRIYLPLEDLEVFGVSEPALQRGVVTGPIRELLRFEIERTRRLYAFAEPGIDMLHPTSRDCVRTAFALYGQILTAVEEAHYQVLTHRVSVPPSRRLSVFLPAMRHARAVRRAERRWVPVGGPGPGHQARA